jgi:predicted CXXCH cytochrome family protein
LEEERPLSDNSGRMKRLRLRVLVLATAFALSIAAAALVWLSPSHWAARATSAASYVGVRRCAGCHAAEEGAWRRSHHANAMAKSTSKTVQGDFNNTSFDYDGVQTRFHRSDGGFLVDTDSADGRTRPFAVEYTIGVFPIQQYLLPGEGGALQALSIVWDARPKEQGGQRWFHLHPGERIDGGNPLHWTAPAQNWNFMCADCHSTHVQKNYDAATHRFDTRWSDIDVACEACHGPGSAHVRWSQWASLPLIGRLAGKDPQLQLRFDERTRPGRLTRALDPSSSLNFAPGIEVQACAQCHSRRTQLTNAYIPREGYADHYKPELLSEPLYYVDGQIRDEVYEYGSFQQSRMFAKGVTCSDCHDPHTAQLRLGGNALCLQCHDRRFDAPSHHFHAAGSAGSQCVNCHMPTRNYMMIDARRDHSIRLPRPDLSVRFGVPNACNGCHIDKNSQWAADWLTQRYGRNHHGLQQFAAQLDAIRRQSPEAEGAIRDLMAGRNVPDLVKATALSEAGPYLQNGITGVLHEGLSHANPSVRLGALQALEDASTDTRWALAEPLLSDPQRSLRIEAARILGGSAPLSDAQRRKLDPAWTDFIAAVRVNADRAEWHLLHATALAARGEAEPAIQESQVAIGLNPRFGGAYVNLADVYRQAGRDDLCERTLVEGLAMDPRSAALHAAMGLLRVRQHRVADAIHELAQATKLDPDNGSYGYLYAAALQTQDANEATRFLETALADSGHRHERSEFFLLLQRVSEQGDRKQIGPYLPQLRALAASDPQARALLTELQ